MLELFAGCVGSALGLSHAGWHHVACLERSPAAAATLRAAGFPAVEADVRDVDHAPREGVELLSVSPPCQPGSTAGQRRGSRDDRDGWRWTVGALDSVQPAWFLADNARFSAPLTVEGVRQEQGVPRIKGEDEIWLLEGGHTSRLYVWSVNGR